MRNNSQKYLPTLQSIVIENFSLYPGDLNLKYDFIKGVNLIIGGNGVGKTTFLNILKYSLIGLYKKEIDVKRREYSGVEYRYEKRLNLPYSYFLNRMTPDVEFNRNASVTLSFFLNEEHFEVTRNLYIPKIEKLFHTKNGTRKEILGKLLTQSEFDTLFSDKKRNEDELFETLQWKYEELVGRASNLDFFDNLIFLINDVLFFGESRKTIMWDGAIQNKLLSKFFIDSKLDDRKEEFEREARYQNSLSRHKSEDIRAIKKIFDGLNPLSKETNYNKLVLDIENTKIAVNSLFKDLELNQKRREKKEIDINKLHSEKNSLTQNIGILEAAKRKEEQGMYSSVFRKVTPKYNDYLKSLKSSHDCPLCNNNINDDFYDHVIHHETSCMMCGNEINENVSYTSEKLKDLKNDLSRELTTLRNIERRIIDEDDELRKMDKVFRSISIDLSNKQSKLRQLEFAIQRHQNENSNINDNEFIALKARIDELEKEKDEALEKSKEAYKSAKEIIDVIDKQRLDSREFLSDIFNNFGSKFLGVPCELVYEDPKDDEGKRYLPRINGLDRLDEEELSESQRFFIDQSFRLSLLNYFNASSSFFMCETPDSSLDISYEKNAAKVYLEYLKQENQLILTSNLNNSEFLEFLIERAKDINYKNLLKVGRRSTIQANSDELKKASEKIENMINGKK
ncbi:AAA family ATPase [Chryseobacterium arthrosphaerae]|uniref:AAA family ATPase n=1 Tax=Chryseobacterium arthrosphaerae TaxID=651561 RepID=UPI0023E1B947|nr:AAA family ATPase [Chryseobacterium arthrosphaerae]WES98293.1 AAA family ATPase [Chryseobacterium arthrosphaerae]